MAFKPNYRFERMQRDRDKASKKAAKRAEREARKASKASEDAPQAGVATGSSEQPARQDVPSPTPSSDDTSDR